MSEPEIRTTWTQQEQDAYDALGGTMSKPLVGGEITLYQAGSTKPLLTMSKRQSGEWFLEFYDERGDSIDMQDESISALRDFLCFHTEKR